MNPHLAVGSVLADRYRVESLLGEGGMGVVVLATHVQLHQRVAIKVLRPEALADADAVSRFVREARAAARIQSEHVVRVHDVGTLVDGTPFMVMEYVEGNDLRQALDNDGVLPLGEAVKYIVQVCEALAETHAAGIIHHDLKPENIYLARGTDGTLKAKLLDFGISRIAMDDRSTSSLVMGTPEYMSPEQLQSPEAVGARSDIWSAGIVLYEMLAGDPPFAGSNLDEVCEQVVSAAHRPIVRADMTQALSDVIDRCLQKNPERRYETVADLARALASHVTVESDVARIERVVSSAGLTGPIPKSTRERTFAPTVVTRRKRGITGPALLVGAGVCALLAITGASLIAMRLLHDARAAEARPAVVQPVQASSSVPAAATTAAAIATTAPTAPTAPTESSESAPPATTAGGTPAVAAAPTLRPRPPRSGIGATASEPRRVPPSGPTVAPGAGQSDRFGTRK